MGSGEMLRLANHSLNVVEDTVCVQTCKPAVLRQTRCSVYEQRCGAVEVLFGNGDFRFDGRLTGFRGARNIVRIRTKCPAANDAKIPAGAATHRD
jgi:hypothetical protein